MGVRLRSRDQTAKWGLAHEKLSSSEESTHEQIRGENHYYCFFPTAVTLCTKNLYLQDRELITPSTKMSWNDFKNGSRGAWRDIADDWVLQHDNAPAHTALSIREFLAKKNIPVLTHPPYSPDLAPCDFYLFPKLKSKVKVHHFRMMENTKNCNWWAKHTYGKWLPVLLWSVEKTLKPLCNLPRVILWRR